MMKKLQGSLTALLMLLFVSAANAQSKAGAEFFAGKWSVLLKDLPQGNTTLLFVLEKKDSTISGIIKDTSGVEISKIDKAEVADSSITLYFTAQGYDVSLLLTKKDEDHVAGTLMNMFDAEGERKKEQGEAKK
jgi:hypothetical protein